MKLTLKNVFLSVGIFVFTLALAGFVSINKVEAAETCTAANSTAWATASTWSCTGASTVPLAADAVIIPANKIVTVGAAGAVAASIVISDPVAAGSNGITISSPGTLVVGGAISIAGSSGASHSTLAVGTGSLSAASIAIVGGASTGNSIVSVGVAGTITVTGDIALSGTAATAQLTSTGASAINVGGSLTSGGTLDGTSSTITFNGTASDSIMGTYNTYNNVVIAKTGSGKVTIGAGATTVGGTLTVTSGILDTFTSGFGVTGITSVASAGTLKFTSATGTKTFTGNVTVSGIWDEAAVATAITFGGNLTNNATSWTGLSTGPHTFAGASKIISGTTATVMPSVAITGDTTNSGTLTVATLLTISVTKTLTNNGTVTAATSLTGLGTFANGTAGTVYLGGTTFDVAAFNTSGTVDYNRAGVQTVRALGYENLILSGSGVKTIGSGIAIGGRLTITGASAALTGDSTSNTLSLGNVAMRFGSWGSSSSSATYKSDAYFSGTGKVTAADGRTISYIGDIDTTPEVTETTTTTTTQTVTPTITVTAVPATPATPGTVVPGCGNRTAGFSTSSGASCVGNTSTVPATPATPAYSYDFGTTTLKNGSKGAAVMELQRFLNQVLNLNLVVDGKLGPKTIDVIKTWQRNNNLEVDGLVGTKTKAKMNASVQ